MVQTLFGAIIDTLADKIVCITLIYPLLKNNLSFLLLIGEVLILITNAIATIKHKKTLVSLLGKIKMWILSIDIIIGYIVIFDYLPVKIFNIFCLLTFLVQMFVIFGYIKNIRIQKENENKDSIFYNKIDLDNIGITGHSQVGVSVFNAITNQEHSDMYKVAVALSPANEELAESLKWHYDASKTNIPIMIVAGTSGKFEIEAVIPFEKLELLYSHINSKKLMMRKTGMEHGQMLYAADGYVTAWFMWKLQGDEEASKAFVGDNPEILNNKLYQDQKIDLE